VSVDIAVQALVDAEAEFVIIGGWSAILHGSRFMTDDLDICFSRERENLRCVAQALAPHRPRLRDAPEGLPCVWDEITLRNGTIFTLDTDLGGIDLLAEVSGLGTFDEVRAASVAVEAFGHQVRKLPHFNSTPEISACLMAS
jgi:hypothetical protein